MDLEALSESGTVALLTLPHSDLHDRSKASSSKTGGSLGGRTTTRSTDRPKHDDASAPLLLLQLPAGWTPRHLRSSHFVSQGSDSAVSLVCESRQLSFSVHACETSNVLVLVPPPPLQPSSATSAESGPAAARKRRKVVVASSGEGGRSATTLEETPARVLRASGASFLELRPRALSLPALRQALPTHHPMAPAPDPEPSGPGIVVPEPGRSLRELSNLLQVTTAEVRKGLRDVGAFCCRTPDVYAMLSDQTIFECNQLVVSALGERHIDYSTAYSLNEMTTFVLDRMSDEEQFESVDRVVRFCLLQLSEEANSYDDDWLEDDPLFDPCARFSLSKVAACVARHLFFLQTDPWEETLFLSRWQGLLPGNGQVDPSMLRGVAVPIRGDGRSADEEVFWKYLPVEGLSPNVREGVDELFRSKPKWTRDELEPYLERYASGDTSGNSSIADLLLRFTKVVEEATPGQSAPSPFHIIR